MSPTPPLRPPGFSRRTLLAASAAGLALLVAGCSSAAGRRAGEGDQRAGRRARGAGRRSRRRSWPRSPRPAPRTRRWPRRWPSWRRRPRRAAGPAEGRRARAPASAASRRPRRRPGRRRGRGCAARWPRRPPRTPRPAWTSRAPGRRCSARSPRVCAARTGGWRDGSARWLTTTGGRRPRRAARRTPRWRGPGRRARRGLGLRRRRAALDEKAAAAGGRRRGGPPRRPRPGQRPARRTRKADPSSTPRVAYALPFPVLSAVDAAALAVVLEDGVTAAWVRVLDQAAERSHPRVRHRRAERRRGACGRLAHGRRQDAGHPRVPRPAAHPRSSDRHAQRRPPRNASVTATAVLLD